MQSVINPELVGFLDFQETKKTNFESWIVGFPRNQLFFFRKLDSWISAKNQQTNMEVGLLDSLQPKFFSNILFEHERSAFRAHAGDYFHDFNSEFAKRAALYFHGISAAVQTKLMKNE